MKKNFAHAMLISAAIVLSAVAAKAKGPVITDPSKVDADYAIQGDYTGTIGQEKIGIQVIARGDGTFNAVKYPGGLPGDGWNADKKNRQKATGATQDGKTILKGGQWSAEISKGKLKLLAADGKELGILDRVDRQSPTLDAKAPQGAAILFDGANTGKWKNGKMDKGLLIQGTQTSDSYGDFKLHIEFRLPYKPKGRGQDRGNSGLYILNLYECQILDSFGLEGVANECGGLYRQKAPGVNMCFPPLTWQTYDIDFSSAKLDAQGKKTQKAKITVRHNGVVIHDNYEFPSGTGSRTKKKEHSAGPLLLQNHGNPVRFRNVWIVPQ
jgi:hypothetical protein